MTEKQKLHHEINREYEEEIKKWKPSFNNPKDIAIKENIEKLSLSRYSEEDKIKIKTHIIYFIKNK